MDPIQEVLERLDAERRLLERLRADYSVITKSRFHALRMIWMSLRSILRRSGAAQSFSVWPPDLAAAKPAYGTDPHTRDCAILPPGPLAQDMGMLPPVAGFEQLFADWKQLAAQAAGDPIVSVIIPVYNNIGVTVRCLQSIADCRITEQPVQVIIVDDASTDLTPAVAGRLAGIDYIRSGTNAGFIRSCNRGAAIARGSYLCFLNNDTIVTAGWLDELVRTAERDATVGAVGSKLVYPNGHLQEAGGIIWSDGNGWNYGRGDDPRDPKYNYVRDVDYCSGAALLVRSDLFRRVGGFSETFVPAYYEDVDMCFALRELGFRVVFQPKSVVIHDEGTSSGVSLDTGVKRYQAVNRPKFVSKWRDALQSHFEHDPGKVASAARRLGRAKTILMIDNYVPEFDKDAGSERTFNIIKQFQSLGLDVIFAPDNYYRSEPYTTALQDMGVEVVYGSDRALSLTSAVRARLALADFAWVARPEIGKKWLPVFKEGSIPAIYDTVDLHFLRIQRELELKKATAPDIWKKWQEDRECELSVIRSADVTVVLGEDEQRTLASEGVNHTVIVPTIHRLHERKNPFEATAGILFIGGYQHPPNVDAALWICNEIMPLVWAKHPDITLTLLGSNPPENVRALASDRVSVPGYLPDVTAHFERARVFAAALRFGAGMKGKVGHAFGYRLPTVSTTVGAEGFGIINGRDAIIADDAASFAEALIRVYYDEALWSALSAGAASRIHECSPERTRERLEKLLAFAAQRARERQLSRA